MNKTKYFFLSSNKWERIDKIHADLMKLSKSYKRVNIHDKNGNLEGYGFYKVKQSFTLDEILNDLDLTQN